MSREISTTEYMQNGWDSGPIGCHPYKRGSRHNQIGMWVMWVYYIVIISMVLRLVWVLNS